MSGRHLVALAVYLILRRGDDVLVIRRQGGGWRDGSFTLPAGHVDEGESARAAMRREAREEVGIEVADPDLELVHTMHRNGPTPYVDLYFRAVRWTGEPTICEPHKASDLTWVPLADPPADTVSTVSAALAHVRRREPYGDDAWPASP